MIRELTDPFPYRGELTGNGLDAEKVDGKLTADPGEKLGEVNSYTGCFFWAGKHEFKVAQEYTLKADLTADAADAARRSWQIDIIFVGDEQPIRVEFRTR
jgi:hypothetical protein